MSGPYSHAKVNPPVRFANPHQQRRESAYDGAATNQFTVSYIRFPAFQSPSF